MNQLQVFENDLFKVSAKLENEQALFNVEQVAISLGITETKNNKKYVMWRRVNQYIKPFGTTAEDSPEVGKGDFIPEPLVYKLAFKASNELAEKFQDWLAIEVIPSIRKTGSYQMEQPKTQAELMLMYADQFVKQEQEIKQLNHKIDNVSNIVSISNVDWRKKTNVILKKIADKWSGIEPYRSVKNLAYERFEQRAGCKLNIRLNNRKKNAATQGMTKTYVQKINKLDCIAEEKRLIEIYIQVVKEMAIQFKVDVSDFEFEGVI